ALVGAGAEVALHSSAEANLEDPVAADRLIFETVERFGRLDILVNNARIIRRQPAASHSDENWDSVIEVSLSSVFRLCRAAGRHVLERPVERLSTSHPCCRFKGK